MTGTSFSFPPSPTFCFFERSVTQRLRFAPEFFAFCFPDPFFCHSLFNVLASSHFLHLFPFAPDAQVSSLAKKALSTFSSLYVWGGVHVPSPFCLFSHSVSAKRPKGTACLRERPWPINTRAPAPPFFNNLPRLVGGAFSSPVLFLDGHPFASEAHLLVFFPGTRGPLYPTRRRQESPPYKPLPLTFVSCLETANVFLFRCLGFKKEFFHGTCPVRQGCFFRKVPFLYLIFFFSSNTSFFASKDAFFEFVPFYFFLSEIVHKYPSLFLKGFFFPFFWVTVIIPYSVP